MSMAEKKRHLHLTGKEESREHSLAHKYDNRKPTTVVNHLHYERAHGYESTKHKDKKAG